MWGSKKGFHSSSLKTFECTEQKEKPSSRETATETARERKKDLKKKESNK